MTGTDGVLASMFTLDAVARVHGGSGNDHGLPPLPTAAPAPSKQTRSRAAAPLRLSPPAIITLTNNVVYNASGTARSRQPGTHGRQRGSVPSISPTSGTTLTLADGRTISFSGGITSSGANSILPGTAPPNIALNSANPVNVTGSLTVGSVIADNPNNGGSAIVTSINQTGSGTLTLTGNNTYTGRHHADERHSPSAPFPTAAPPDRWARPPRLHPTSSSPAARCNTPAPGRPAPTAASPSIRPSSRPSTSRARPAT